MADRYAVIGGGGFVGKALARALREAGHSVVSISRGSYPDLEAIGAESVQADITQPCESWWHALEGCDGVFHTAAKVDMWGPYAGFFRTNVLGTRNVLEACNRAGVKRLVFTSSPSVIHDGSDLCGIDESYPYPKHFDAFYPMTKAQAEREVRAADTPGALRTVALRPHLIWGPGDTHLVPTIVERAKAGRLRRIGDGSNVVDLTYIDDCVAAHLCAMQTLETNPDRAGGKVYFVSQGDPVKMWQWIDDVLLAHGLKPVRRSLSIKAALFAARIMEAVSCALRLVGIQSKPLLTRFLVSEMATSHYFSIENAKRDLGFQPSRSVSEALKSAFQKAA